MSASFSNYNGSGFYILSVDPSAIQYPGDFYLNTNFRHWVDLANAANGWAQLDDDGNLNGIFTVRQNTYSNLITLTLLSGEIAYATDTHQIFIGDGVTVGGFILLTGKFSSTDGAEAIAEISNAPTGSPFAWFSPDWDYTGEDTGTFLFSIGSDPTNNFDGTPLSCSIVLYTQGTALSLNNQNGDFGLGYPIAANSVALNSIWLNGNIAVSPLAILTSSYISEGNSGTSLTTLTTSEYLAGTFNATFLRLRIKLSGSFVYSSSQKALTLSFAGTTLLSTGALTTTANSSWIIECEIVITGNTSCIATVKCSVSSVSSPPASPVVKVITGLNFATTSYYLTLQGQASSTGAATNDIVLLLSSVDVSNQ